QHLDFSCRRQLANHVEILRVTRLEPFQQRTRQVHHDRKKLALGQSLQQRKVDVSSMLLEHVTEVSNRLMLMHSEYESKWLDCVSCHSRAASSGSAVITFLRQIS